MGSDSCTLSLLIGLSITLLTLGPRPGGSTDALLGCRGRCGSVAVPYPFGIGEGCYFDERFNISCVDSLDFPSKAYMGRRELNVTNISIEDSELRVLQYVTRDCYTESGYDPARSRDTGIRTLPSAFTVSATRNKFTALGCDTNARIGGYTAEGRSYSSGCMSVCDRLADVDFGSCSGMGCCQVASIPKSLVNVTVTLRSSLNHSQVLDFNPCSYAVLAEETQFRFSDKSFGDFRDEDDFPLILDWRIGNSNCSQARKLGNFACKNNNSECAESTTGTGYICRCSHGFDGNPYHPDGCHDIDECKDPQQCINGTCDNTNGGFSCTCLKGYNRYNATMCTIKDNARQDRVLLLYVPLGISIGVIAFVLGCLMLFWGQRKRKLMRQREKFFEQNGGLILQQRLLSDTNQRGSLEAATIFSEEELRTATNNYSEILGEGGYGTVYRGTLTDERAVAIKKPKTGGAHAQTNRQTEQFINELVLLMQINHRNVVRLLGCCLDTEVPILVYEFISNGTLFECIHRGGSGDFPPISWDSRLKIAAETAGALAYLHHETNTPIVHRDVKTMNILLDESYAAKVSDFGTSRLIPVDQDQVSTLVQGTIGYLDPEYLQSSQLTEKSDVYSFGVVLAELLTGERAFSFNKSEGTNKILAMTFVSVKEDQIRTVIDDAIDFEAHGEAVKEVANIARRCLSVRGDERPTMKEVSIELLGLRAVSKHPWGEEVEYLRDEEGECLLGYDVERGQSTTDFVLDNSMRSLCIDAGR